MINHVLEFCIAHAYDQNYQNSHLSNARAQIPGACVAKVCINRL